MEKHKISIIVPIYNVEDYLEHCIESICAQTYQNLEIILVDDGSMDHSGQICDHYAALDPRIAVIHQKNQGLVRARKAGLQQAQGEYIGFVDGDDYLEPGMYTALMEILLKENVDFVHSGYFIDEKTGIHGIERLESGCAVWTNHGNRAECLQEYVLNIISSKKISSSAWSKLYRRDFIRSAYFEVPDENSYGEDLLCLCSCLLRCESFCVIDKAYYHYVTRGDSLFHRKSVENTQKEYRLYAALGNLFRQHGVYGELQSALERYYLYSVTACIKHLGNSVCPLYQYPLEEELAGKKIILYGAGEVGQDYYTQLRRDMRCEVLAVTDSRYRNYSFPYMNLISPEEILKYPYDRIVIAVLWEGIAEDIKKSLLEKGVPAEKILWKKPSLTV